MSSIREKLTSLANEVDRLNYRLENLRSDAPEKFVTALRRNRRAVQWAFCELVKLTEDPNLHARAARFAQEHLERKLAYAERNRLNYLSLHDIDSGAADAPDRPLSDL